MTAVLFAHSAAAARPNIVLFIVDDMTWSDAGCYGSKEVKTPNIDKLATQGMRFNNCSTSTAMCAPTRQQLYTGLWPVRSGAYPNHSAVKNGTKSLGQHFRQLGYRVAISGKKHYKPAKSYPFETLPGGMSHDSGKADKKDLNLDAIQKFIARDRKQPYFLICATNQPHAPWNRGDATAYDPDKLVLPWRMVDTPVTRELLAAYYAEVTYADMLLGKVLDTLDLEEQADNTIVLFTSEQGSQFPFGKWTCYETGLKTGLIVRWPGQVKAGSTTDAMVQYVDVVPTLIEAAGGDPAKVKTGRAGAPDGGSGFDGTSFLGVFQGKSDKHRDYAFGVHTTRGIINGSDCYPIRSVRDKDFKLILNLKPEPGFKNILMAKGRDALWQSWVSKAKAGDQHAAELVKRYQHRPAVEFYHLKTDPDERVNQANEPAYRKDRDRLMRELQRWMKQQGDQGIATEMQATPRK